MNHRFYGWARCHPKCNWFNYAEANDYERCWHLLRESVAMARQPRRALVSMVVLPCGEHPAHLKRRRA